MFKRIGTKEYNTETAERMAIFETDLSPLSEYYYTETLFRKKSGEWFIYGSGNAQTKYATEQIKPLTQSEAMLWAQTKIGPIDPDLYKKIFFRDDPTYGGNTFQMRIKPERLEKLHAEAKRRGVSAAELINGFIDSL